MSRYELGMTLNYAKSWGVVEAVREFFQNAYDEEVANHSNKMFFEYADGVLLIGNEKSVLEPRTLLMGSTTKDGNKDLIGEHGEGYKVATVVLMRNGVTVKIYNNEKGEVWTSKVVKSRRYGTEIVVFDIQKQFFKKKYNLVFELDGITEDMYKAIVESNLHLRKDIDEDLCKHGEHGTILMQEQFKGDLYVNGLFICNRNYLEWGYDFAPSLVQLDRDRGLVDYFDLKFAISRLVMSTKDADFIHKNIKNKDLEFIHTSSQYDTLELVSDKVYEDFIEEHGEGAYPTEEFDEYEELTKQGYNAVYLPRSINQVIRHAHEQDFVLENKEDIQERFENWLERAEATLSENLVEEIQGLWNELSEKASES